MSDRRQANLALFEAWKADDKVVAFAAAVRQHALQDGGGCDAAGMTATLRFATAWLRENGDLPNPGIRDFD